MTDSTQHGNDSQDGTTAKALSEMPPSESIVVSDSRIVSPTEFLARRDACETARARSRLDFVRRLPAERQPLLLRHFPEFRTYAGIRFLSEESCAEIWRDLDLSWRYSEAALANAEAVHRRFGPEPTARAWDALMWAQAAHFNCLRVKWRVEAANSLSVRARESFERGSGDLRVRSFLVRLLFSLERRNGSPTEPSALCQQLDRLASMQETADEEVTMRLQLSAWHQDFGDPWQALDYLRECLALEPKLGRSELSVGIVCNLNLLRLLAEDSVLQDHGASPALREHGGEAGLTLAHELTSVSAQCAAAQGNQEYSNGAWAKTLPVFQKRSPGSAQAKLCQAIFSAIRLAGLGQTVRASRLLSSFSGPLLSVGEGEAAASCRRVDALTIVSRQSVTEIGREALAYLSPKVPWISGYLDRRA